MCSVKMKSNASDGRGNGRVTFSVAPRGDRLHVGVQPSGQEVAPAAELKLPDLVLSEVALQEAASARTNRRRA